MKMNVGGIDKMARIALGMVLLSAVALLDGGARWLCLIGLVSVVTGLVRFCPLYSVLGVNTIAPKTGAH